MGRGDDLSWVVRLDRSGANGMCGIIGVTSTKPVAAKLAQGVRRLEYRGYDSVGVATLDSGTIEVRKADQVDSDLDFNAAPGNLGIAHCRWGTHR